MGRRKITAAVLTPEERELLARVEASTPSAFERAVLAAYDAKVPRRLIGEAAGMTEAGVYKLARRNGRTVSREEEE